MKLCQLCDICVEHEYYNAGTSERLQMQLVPSVESARVIRNLRILVTKDKNTFSLYGDVFQPGQTPGTQKLRREFTLSFALTVFDPCFLEAADLKRPEEVNAADTRTLLRQDSSRRVYYFHNRRKDLIEGRAVLSEAAQVSEKDLVQLYPLRLTMEGLPEISDLTLATEIPFTGDNDENRPFQYSVVTDPQDKNHVNRIFRADLGAFGGGHYVFSYQNPSESAPISTGFYLSDEFYRLRPFAIIDLFFSESLSVSYQPPGKVYHVSLPARRCRWRYHIISKFHQYGGLKIKPDNLFKAAGEKTLASGETATVFESLSERPLQEVTQDSLELMGKHIPSLDADGGDNRDNDREIPGTETTLRRLAPPTVENLVLTRTKKPDTAGDGEATEYYCDMFVYI